MIRLLTAMLTIALAAALARGAEGPLEKGLVRADATWVFHIDLEAVRASRLMSVVESADLERDLPEEDREHWRRIRPVLEKLISVTVYGKNDPDRAVVLLRTTATAEEFFAAMRCGELEEAVVEGAAEAGGYTLRTWTVEGDTVYGYAGEGKTEGEGAGLIFVSNDTESIVAAIDTVLGKRPSLGEAGDGGTLDEAATARPGSAVLMAASNLEMLPREARASFLLENARALRIELGEHDGQVYGSVRLTTASTERTRQVVDMARGVVAMGQIMAGQEERYAGLRGALGALEITAEGESATVAFTYDAAAVFEALLSARAAGRAIREGREPGAAAGAAGEPAGASAGGAASEPAGR